MAGKNSKISVREKDVDSTFSRQLEMYRHNQAQAQRFVRTLLSLVALFGVSATLTIITSWQDLRGLVPNRTEAVFNSYDISKGFVESTVQANAWVGGIALAISAILIGFSFSRMGFVLKSRPVLPAMGELPIDKEIELEEGQEHSEDLIEKNHEKLAKQRANLNLSYKAAYVGGFLASFSAIIMALVVTNSADYLATLNILIMVATLSLIMDTGSKLAAGIIAGLTDMVCRTFGNGERVTLSELQENYRRNLLFTPSVAVSQLILYLWFAGFILSSLLGLLWWFSAFVDVVEKQLVDTPIQFLIRSEIPYFKVSFALLASIFLLKTLVELRAYPNFVQQVIVQPRERVQEWKRRLAKPKDEQEDKTATED